MPDNRHGIRCLLIILGVLLSAAKAWGDDDFVVAKLGDVGLKAEGEIVAIAYSPDGEFLGAVSEAQRGVDSELRLWRTTTGQLVRKLPMNSPAAFRFSKDNREVFTARATLQIETGELSLSTLHGAFGFSRDGRLVAGYGAIPTSLVVRKRNAPINLFSTTLGGDRARLVAAEFSPQGDRLAVATSDERLLLFDVATAEKTMEQAIGRVMQLAFSPDGRRLAAVDRSHAVSVFDLTTGKRYRTLKTALPRCELTVFAYSPDGRFLAAAGPGGQEIVVWDVESGRIASTIETQLTEIRALAFSPDGRQLAAAGAGPYGANPQVWNLADGVEQYVPPGPRKPVSRVAFSADGRRLASGCSEDGVIHLWDVAQSLPLRTWQAQCAESLQFSADDRRICAVGHHGATSVWKADADDGIPESPMSVKRGDANATCLSSDAKRLAHGTTTGEIELREIELRETETPVTGRRFRAYERPAEVGDLAFSPDGRFLASTVDASQQSTRRLLGIAAPFTVQVWDAQSQELVSTGKADRVRKEDGSPIAGDTLVGLNFSPGSEMLAGRLQKSPRMLLWDVATGRTLMQLPSNSLASCFSPTGRCFVTQQGANLEVIELLTQTRCLSLPLDQAAERASPQAASLAISPNGDLVACGFVRENSIALLSLAPRRRHRAGGATTNAEMEQDWQTLAQYDAETAYASAWRLATRRDAAVEFLGERIEPAKSVPLDKQHVEQLIRNLDHREFDARQTATRELEMLGEAVLSHLKHAATHNHSKELNLRVAHIVDAIRSGDREVPGKTLRTVRAIDVLERIGTPAAQTVLKKIAAGESAARETLEAQRSLARLRTHEALSPDR